MNSTVEEAEDLEKKTQQTAEVRPLSNGGGCKEFLVRFPKWGNRWQVFLMNCVYQPSSEID